VAHSPGFPFFPERDPEALPAEVQAAIDASVQRFEGRFAKMGYPVLLMARGQMWIEDYRSEITELVRFAREKS